MPGGLDILAMLAGQPDPRVQLMRALGQAQGQPGSPAGPNPMAPPAPSAGAGAAPAGAPPAPAGPAAPGPQGAQGPQQGQQPQQPQPQAYQSPPDLASLYMQLDARNRASDQFNRSLAGLAASAYPGRNPGPMVQALTGGQPEDVGSLFNNVMKLQEYQNFQAQAGDLAQKTGLTRGEVLAAGPGILNSVVQANMPPEAMRNWIFAKKQWIQSHPEDPNGTQFEQQFPMSMAIVGGMPGLNDTDRQRMLTLQNYQQQNPGKPAPTWLTNTVAFQNYQKDLGDAQGNFAQLNQRSQEAVDTIDRIKNNPNLGSALKILSTTGGHGADIAAMAGAIDPQTKQAVDDIEMLGGQVYAEGFRSTGSRRTQQEVQAIVEGLSKLNKTGYSADDYTKTVLTPIQQRIQEAEANNYGASQQLDSMPDNLKPLVNKIYLPGGTMYGGQGGKSWFFQGMPEAEAKTAYDQLPPGAIYIDQNGESHKKT